MHPIGTNNSEKRLSIVFPPTVKKVILNIIRQRYFRRVPLLVYLLGRPPIPKVLSQYLHKHVVRQFLEHFQEEWKCVMISPQAFQRNEILLMTKNLLVKDTRKTLDVYLARYL